MINEVSQTKDNSKCYYSAQNSKETDICKILEEFLFF